MTCKDLIIHCMKLTKAATHEELSRKMNCHSSAICLIYQGKSSKGNIVGVGPAFILKVHEQLGVPVKEIREIIAKPPQK